ncbi:MAG: hypothetical protein WCI05_07940 [Myxococcales bacterium]
MPLVHGSQGGASYYRSTLNRHFREPAAVAWIDSLVRTKAPCAPQ